MYSRSLSELTKSWLSDHKLLFSHTHTLHNIHTNKQTHIYPYIHTYKHTYIIDPRRRCNQDSSMDWCNGYSVLAVQHEVMGSIPGFLFYFIHIWGARFDLLLVIVRPATKKTLSLRVLVAEMHKTFLAKLVNICRVDDFFFQ